ncbi:DUF4917 family protein [Zhongshania marina]|uniref:DUF4917 domain-containing protein n=1 Tax=Zhongshania marina TaxID=2304603 RepID=A0A2S4HAJ2_9GAMM|nr:DUF4917 family protein [Marortus luteolus]POP50996.1 DUF4917 domain-containing protein [Marortus luteolus]
MTEHRIDEHLIDWNEIAEAGWQSLLLGNGFSMNVWTRFGYGTLFELAQLPDLEHRLTNESIALFGHVGSANFEDVLRILFHAKLVDEQIGNPQQEAISQLYSNTKNALASAVNFAHVPHGQADVTTINRELRRFSDVFSTNYDLLPYWSILHDEIWRFKDYFWGANSTFDLTDTEVPADRTKIHYLHGAIHLVELADGKTQKLTCGEDGNLRELFDLAAEDKFPLFISEGSWKRKLSRIKRNDYLRFCFEGFSRLNGGLVVLGHSLHKDYDQHIVDSMAASSLTKIAIGVWPHQDAEAIVAFKSRIAHDISGKQLHFYNSETHPLGAVELRVET